MISAALVLLFVLPAAGASAAIRIGIAHSSITVLNARFPTPALVSDGERFVAFVPFRGTIRVLDTKTNHWRDVSSPCAPVAAGAAHVLLACARFRYRILSVGSLRVRRVRQLPESAYVQMGRYWIAVVCGWACPEQPTSFPGEVVGKYLNWHTGQVRTVYGLRNLDSPRLARRRAPRVLSVSSRVLDWDTERALEVRDPQGRVTRICRRGCSSVEASAGKITWLRYHHFTPVYTGYDIVTHARWRWRIRVAWRLRNAAADLGSVVHTRYEALVSTLTADYHRSGAATYKILGYRWSDPTRG